MKKIAFALVLMLMPPIAVSAAETNTVHSGYGTYLYVSDTDYDGKLTAADARKALRIAAGLEKGHEFWFNTSGCGAWWQY